MRERSLSAVPPSIVFLYCSPHSLTTNGELGERCRLQSHCVWAFRHRPMPASATYLLCHGVCRARPCWRIRFRGVRWLSRSAQPQLSFSAAMKAVQTMRIPKCWIEYELPTSALVFRPHHQHRVILSGEQRSRRTCCSLATTPNLLHDQASKPGRWRFHSPRSPSHEKAPRSANRPRICGTASGPCQTRIHEEGGFSRRGTFDVAATRTPGNSVKPVNPRKTIQTKSTSEAPIYPFELPWRRSIHAVSSHEWVFARSANRLA